MTKRIENTTRIAASIAAIAVLVMGLSVASPAFALQPYIGAYTDQPYTKGTSFSGRVDFSGTVTAVPRDGWIGPVSSTGTFASASATTPTGWAHQMAVILNDVSNAVYAQFNVNDDGTCVASMGSETDCSGSIPSLGNYGETAGSSSQINYVYLLSQVTSTTVSYYWEVTKNNGAVGTTILATYTKSSDGDPSNRFGQGTKSVSIAGTTYKFKFYQVGVEASEDNLDETWKVKQYDHTFGTTILSDVPARSVERNGVTNGAFLTYWGTTSCTTQCLIIGQEKFDNANLDSNWEIPSIPKGQIFWKKGTATPGGTQVWT